MKFVFERPSGFEKRSLKMVEDDGHSDDGRTPEDPYTLSSPCEPSYY